MFIRSASVCSLLMLISTGLGAVAQPLSTSPITVDSDAAVPLHLITERDGSLPGFVARRIQKDLGDRLNVPFHDLKVSEATSQVWPDACLGVANPEELCAQAEVRGWEVKVRSSQQTWTYRSDRTATRLRLISNHATEFNRGEFSRAIAQKILETASQQVQEPVDNLQILSAQSAVWDGCLGIAAPNQVCTKNVVPGFKVIVGSEPRTVDGLGKRETYHTIAVPKEWVYHVSEDGSQIIQNTAASNPRRLSGTYFMSPSTQIPELGTSVFKLTFNPIYGSPSGVITLEADGTIHYKFFDDSVEGISYQIPLEAVSEIETLLNQPEFSNFDQMVYTDEDPGLADGGSLVLTAAGTSVGFSSEERLPASLKGVVEAVLKAAR